MRSRSLTPNEPSALRSASMILAKAISAAFIAGTQDSRTRRALNDAAARRWLLLKPVESRALAASDCKSPLGGQHAMLSGELVLDGRAHVGGLEVRDAGCRHSAGGYLGGKAALARCALGAASQGAPVPPGLPTSARRAGERQGRQSRRELSKHRPSGTHGQRKRGTGRSRGRDPALLEVTANAFANHAANATAVDLGLDATRVAFQLDGDPADLDDAQWVRHDGHHAAQWRNANTNKGRWRIVRIAHKLSSSSSGSS